ncbi:MULTISPECIES: DMT family transporter [unclassified Caulobacter]|uniref:EamA family transporter n=1 Tax=unclassified Caulobacter TaxID=2648921 RepID=UPI0007814911|nr:MULTISPECIES: DMT family transporter [unclassified Caulobacter]AZS19659.1 DMT family transporter [Caulobacter sp. FWC26]
MSGPRAPILPYAALLAAIITLCVGTSFAKTLFPLVGAQGVTAYRVGFSALILLVVWRPWRHPISGADLGKVAMYGAVMGAMNLCFYMAIRTIPLGLAIAIEFIGPLVLAIAYSRRLIHLVWIALAILGLGLLLPINPGAKPLDPVGVAYACAAAVMWALYIILGKRTGHLHAGRSVALGMTTAALIVAPVGLASAGATLFDPKIAALGLVVAVLSSAIPYSLEMIALRGIPKRSFGVLLSLEPAAGALAGLAILHERLVLTQWLAIAAIVAASAGTILTTPAEAVSEDVP